MSLVRGAILGLAVSTGIYISLGALSYASRSFSAGAAFLYVFAEFHSKLLLHPLAFVNVVLNGAVVSFLFGGFIVVGLFAFCGWALGRSTPRIDGKIVRTAVLSAATLALYGIGLALGVLVWLEGIRLPAL
jgi:hypothetical protein